MSFWTAAVVIVAILAFAGMRIARYRAGWGDYGEGRGDAPREQGRRSNPPSPREEDLTREIAELHQRLAVLERIATDANSSSARSSKAISDEIDSLRDR